MKIDKKVDNEVIEKEENLKKENNYIKNYSSDRFEKANTNITHAFEQMIDLIEKDDNLKSEISSFALNKKSHINEGQKMQCC